MRRKAYHHAQAEYHNMVIGLNNGITCYQYTVTVADESADGRTFGQSGVLDGAFGNARPVLNCELDRKSVV